MTLFLFVALCLAYYATELITAVISLIIQAPVCSSLPLSLVICSDTSRSEPNVIKLFSAVIYKSS